MTGKLYTLGYRNQGDEALALLDVMMAEKVPDAQKPPPRITNVYPHFLYTHLLIDVRMSPKAPMDGRWNKGVLEKRFPGRYQHIAWFGNVNYRPVDQKRGICLQDAALGYSMVSPYLPTHHLILLCACPDYHTCHRLVVAEYIQERLPELVVEHLLVPTQPFKQESLF